MDFLESLDQSFLNAILARRQPWLDPLMLAVTELGGPVLLTGALVVFTGLLLWQRQARGAGLLVLAFVCSLILEQAIKPWVGRARPDIGLALTAPPASPSFPSGHALGATCVYAGAALVAGPRLRPRPARRGAVALGLSLAFLVGVSRLYLGVNYVTDVVAGWSAGLALALTARELAGPENSGSRRR
jgi:undecaprenyl-diphosphatase